ncbi:MULTISPECIES: hypothetical protein [Methylobacterium]|uniref:hypothetical protein n=1 Tax=Methylobacterium TaxID=407 RepID=UPI00104733AA|nr:MULTISPECIES: hypothetical protein [Methylobacterium]MDR7035449.1 hypothetical protein [Methylobacterium sp. BE186]
METILILAAVAALAIAGTMAAAMMARGRRPPLRLPNDPDDDDEPFVLGGVGRRESPIDRSAPVLDLEPIEPGREADAHRPRRGPGEGR